MVVATMLEKHMIKLEAMRVLVFDQVNWNAICCLIVTQLFLVAQILKFQLYMEAGTFYEQSDMLFKSLFKVV